jgi:hypothetical protein
MTLNGQIDSVLLKPGESAYGVENIVGQITFLVRGRYVVEYQLDVGYSFYTGTADSESESSLMKSYPRADHREITQGKLDVRITPDLVSSL